MADRGFQRQDVLQIEGELVLEFALISEEEDRIQINDFDLFDLVSSQFSIDSMEHQQHLGRFRITVEKID